MYYTSSYKPSTMIVAERYSVHSAFSVVSSIFYTWTIIYIFLAPTSMTGQDSLLQRIKIVDEPIEKLTLIRQVISANFYNNTDLADSCANVFIDVSKSLGDDSLYVSGIMAKASIKLVKAEYDSTFHYTKIALDLLGNNSYPLLKAKLLHVNALADYYRGNYEKSLEQNFESLKIREAESRIDLQIKSLNNIAIAYERLQEYDNAILYNKKALELTPSEDIYSQASLQNNIASVLISQGKLSEALENLELANQRAIAIDNKLLIVDTHVGMAKTYFEIEEYTKAQLHAQDGLNLSETIGNKAKTISSLNIIASIKIKTKNYSEALPLLNKALQISLDNNIEETRMDVYQNLSEVYSRLNNYKASGRMKDSLILMKNKVYQEEKSKIAKELNIKYESIKKDVLLKDNQISLVKQKNQKNLLLIITGFVLLLATFIFAYMRNRMKSNKKIAFQQSELKSQRIDHLEKENKILAMSSMIEGQESERKRIAQDLHDGLGGLLATIKVKFGVIQKEIAELESMNVYKQTSTMIDDACAEVRKIAHNMMPDALGKLGLIAAVQDISEYTTDMDIKLVDLGIGDLTEVQEIMLYRVIQEFITNSRKHANAKQIIIQFSKDENHINVDLEDDGKGFLIKESQNLGLGLKNIESRISFINGKIEIDSELGVGTTMHIHIPIEKT